MIPDFQFPIADCRSKYLAVPRGFSPLQLGTAVNALGVLKMPAFSSLSSTLENANWQSAIGNRQ